MIICTNANYVVCLLYAVQLMIVQVQSLRLYVVLGRTYPEAVVATG
jgi:hypothetical protein